MNRRFSSWLKSVVILVALSIFIFFILFNGNAKSDSSRHQLSVKIQKQSKRHEKISSQKPTKYLPLEYKLYLPSIQTGQYYYITQTDLGFKLLAHRSMRYGENDGDACITSICEKIFQECKMAIKEKRKSPLVVDIGANIGLFSLLAASRGCRVIAFEPHPTIVNITLANVMINNFEHLISVYRLAISDLNTTLKFVAQDIFKNEGGQSHISNKNIHIDGAAMTMEIKSARLDEIIDEEILLLKIDVEGHDYHAMMSAKKLIEKNKVKNIISEYTVYHMPMNENIAMLQYLKDQGYTIEECDRKRPKTLAIGDDIQKFIKYHQDKHLQTDIFAYKK